MLARKALLIFLVNVVGASLGLAATYFIGHYMGAAPLGMWATALAMVGLLGFLGDFGFSYAHRKKVSEHGADVGRCVGTLLLLRNLGLVGMVAIAAGGLFVWLVVLGKGFTDATSLSILALALAYQALVLLLLVPKSTFYGLGRVAQAETTTLVEHLVRVPLVVLAALAFASLRGRDVPMAALAEALASLLPAGAASAQRGGEMLAVANLAAMGAALLVGFALFRVHRYAVARPDRRLLREYWMLALPIGLMAGVQVLSAHLDTVMIAYFWGARDAGGYFAAQRIMLLVVGISSALYTALFPQISNIHSRREAHLLSRTILTAVRYLSLVIFPVAAFLFVLAGPVLKLILGNEFLFATPVLQVLAVNVLLLSISRPYFALVAGTGRPFTLLLAGLVVNATNLLLNLVLIPRSILGMPLAGLKATGAALATLCSSLVGLVYFAVVGGRIAELSGAWRPVARHTVAALAAGGLLWGLVSLPILGGFVRYYQIAAGALFIAAVYGAVLWLLGELRRRDLDVLGDMAHPIRMVRYWWREVRHGKER